MVQEIAISAVRIKFTFEAAMMTGKYEASYAIGIVSKYLNLPLEEEIQDIKDLLVKVVTKAEESNINDSKMNKLIGMLKECTIKTTEADEDSRALYKKGYEDDRGI